jgi:hypothetical protein
VIYVREQKIRQERKTREGWKEGKEKRGKKKEVVA